MEYDGATDWIGETFVSDAGWRHIERLVDIGNRMAGSDGERRAAQGPPHPPGRPAPDTPLHPVRLQGRGRGARAVAAAPPPPAGG